MSIWNTHKLAAVRGVNDPRPDLGLEAMEWDGMGWGGVVGQAIKFLCLPSFFSVNDYPLKMTEKRVHFTEILMSPKRKMERSKELTSKLPTPSPPPSTIQWC